jgi:hypothetical protein
LIEPSFSTFFKSKIKKKKKGKRKKGGDEKKREPKFDLECSRILPFLFFFLFLSFPKKKKNSTKIKIKEGFNSLWEMEAFYFEEKSRREITSRDKITH